MSALRKQIGGNHYKEQGIQPIEYIHANGLDFFEGNAVKYITRHRTKGGKADIEKAIHYLELLLELDYKENNDERGQKAHSRRAVETAGIRTRRTQHDQSRRHRGNGRSGGRR